MRGELLLSTTVLFSFTAPPIYTHTHTQKVDKITLSTNKYTLSGIQYAWAHTPEELHGVIYGLPLMSSTAFLAYKQQWLIVLLFGSVESHIINSPLFSFSFPPAKSTECLLLTDWLASVENCMNEPCVQWTRGERRMHGKLLATNCERNIMAPVFLISLIICYSWSVIYSQTIFLF